MVALPVSSADAALIEAGADAQRQQVELIRRWLDRPLSDRRERVRILREGAGFSLHPRPVRLAPAEKAAMPPSVIAAPALTAAEAWKTDHPWAQPITIREASARAGVTRSTIDTWVRRGLVAYVRTPGGRVRILPESLFPGGPQRVGSELDAGGRAALGT